MNFDMGSDWAKLMLAVLSSTVINGLINIFWSARIRKQDIEKNKIEERHKAGHVYLLVVENLEKFVRDCHERIDEIYEGLDDFRNSRDTDRLNKLPEIKFSFDPSLDWQILPVSFVADLKNIAQRFEQCNLWIRAEWNCGIDWDTAYEFEQERLAHYGFQVCKVASDIRSNIAVDSSDMEPHTKRFNKLIQSKRKQFHTDSISYPVIPELQALFSGGNHIE